MRFPVDVKVIAQRDDVEDFGAEPLEVRAYAYGERTEGIIAPVPIQVIWYDPGPVDIEEDDGGGGG